LLSRGFPQQRPIVQPFLAMPPVTSSIVLRDEAPTSDPGIPSLAGAIGRSGH